MAGEPPADDINGGEVVGPDLSHVCESLSVGEVSGEDGPAEGIKLDLPDGSHPGSLEADVGATDPRKETPDPHINRAF